MPGDLGWEAGGGEEDRGAVTGSVPFLNYSFPTLLLWYAA